MTTTDDDESNSGPLDDSKNVETSEHLSSRKRTKVTIDRDSWLNTRLLKILGIVYGIATPFIVWVIVSIYDAKTDRELFKAELAYLKDKLNTINTIYNKMDELQKSIGNIQVDIATLKARANIQ